MKIGDRVYLKPSLHETDDTEFRAIFGLRIQERKPKSGVVVKVFPSTVLVKFDGTWRVGEIGGCEILVDKDDIEPNPRISELRGMTDKEKVIYLHANGWASARFGKHVLRWRNVNDVDGAWISLEKAIEIQIEKEGNNGKRCA